MEGFMKLKYKTPQMVFNSIRTGKVKRNSIMVAIRKHRQKGDPEYVKILTQGVILYDEWLSAQP